MINTSPLAIYSKRIVKKTFQTRIFSSQTTSSSEPPAVDEPPQQPFVQTRIQAGEWDYPHRTNPLYRPRWKSRAKIISVEDFNNRPTVGMDDGEFESLQDAMVTLSWLDSTDMKNIYNLYLQLQGHSSEKYKTTSHEYVVRVIAQKYNLTAERVAGVIQLQHNEEQYKREGRELLTETAEYMDRAIKNEIQDAYQTFGQKKPEEFVEDPVGSAVNMQESKKYQTVDDVFDVEQMMKDAILREENEARALIDGHVYLEDQDDAAVSIPISRTAKRLLQEKERLDSEALKSSSVDLPVRMDGSKRPRWKYVAQVVSTRELKKAKAKHNGYKNNSPADTLVEEDGKLRVANLEDVKQTAWKPVRNLLEHTYWRAKKGWLDRSVRGDDSAWGMAPAPLARSRLIEETLQAVHESSSSESGESSGPDSDQSDDDTGSAEESDVEDENRDDIVDEDSIGPEKTK